MEGMLLRKDLQSLQYEIQYLHKNVYILDIFIYAGYKYRHELHHDNIIINCNKIQPL